MITPMVPIAQVETGVFLDSAVSGIGYTTPTRSGTTDSNGTFEYLPGETVTFNLGSLELGSARGQAEVRLFDLAGIEAIPTNKSALIASLWTYETNSPGPMSRVINLAMLLQALDLDADPDNGIEIPAAITSLLDPTLDLDNHYTEFRIGGNGRDARGLPGLLRAAVNAEIFAARPVPSPGKALQHVFDQAGIELPIWSYTNLTYEDGNGDATYVQVRTFDAAGSAVRENTDQNGDGDLNATVERTFDDNLSLTSFVRDNDLDGSPDFVREDVYNEFGVRVSSENRDGSGALISWEHLEFDNEGNLIRRGTNGAVQNWIVDDAGMRSRAEIDSNLDGDIDQRVAVTYPNNLSRGDAWVRAEYDNDLDGNYDEVRTRTFNEAGQLLTVEHDDDLDGEFDYVAYSTYTDIGLQSSYRLDRDGDGVFDYEYFATYNAAGRAVEERVDYNGDGQFSRSVMFYSPEGLLERFERYDDEDQSDASSINFYTHDTDGNEISRGVDSDGDGNIDDFYTYSYHPNGEREETITDRDNDGIVDRIQRRSGWEDTGISSLF